MQQEHPPSHRQEGEAAVSPIIGTLFVFVIIIMGMSGGLVFGVPAIKGIQDRATLGDMAGQLEQVREEAERLTVEGAGASISLAPSSGSVSIENGTRMAVAISYDGSSTQTGLALAWGKGGRKKAADKVHPECDFHVRDWADGNNQVTLVASACDAPMNYVPTATANKDKCWAASNKDTACLQAFNLAHPGSPPVNQVTSVVPVNGQTDTYTVTLNESLRGDWYMQMSDDPSKGPDDNLYAKWYVFGMDQLRWVRDEGLTTWLEGGAVFGTRLDTDYVVNDPIIDEEIVDTADTEPTYYMRIIRFQGEDASIGPGAGTVQVHLRHLQTQSTANDNVTLIRFDFAGESAPLWCDSLLRRDVPVGYYYTEHEFDADAGTDPRCDGNPSTGVQSVKYHHPKVTCVDKNNCAAGTKNAKSFQVVFTEVHFDVKLRP